MMTETDLIRVLIVDDNDATRSGLAMFLEAFDDLELVGQATDGLEGLQLCERVQPDVVLMDLVMPQMDGITATRAIRRSFPHTQVVVLTGFGGQELASGALRAGAAAFLLKNASIDELANAIRAAKSASAAPQVLMAQ
jgi:NarL family two-component system response regulator LiaR